MSFPTSTHRVRALPIDFSEAEFVQLLSEHHVQPLVVDGRPLVSIARDAESQNSLRTATFTVRDNADGPLRLPSEVHGQNLRIDSIMEGFTPLSDPRDDGDYVK